MAKQPFPVVAAVAVAARNPIGSSICLTVAVGGRRVKRGMLVVIVAVAGIGGGVSDLGCGVRVCVRVCVVVRITGSRVVVSLHLWIIIHVSGLEAAAAAARWVFIVGGRLS